MPDHPTPASAIARLNAVAETDRRNPRAASWATRYRRIVEAAVIAPVALSPQGRRTLDWPAEWAEPTIEGLVEILGAVRTADHGAGIDRKVAALRESEAATDAALARYDDRGAAR